MKKKKKEKDAQHNTIAHHLLTDALPAPEQQQSQQPQLYCLLSMVSPLMENPFGHFGSAVLVVSP